MKREKPILFSAPMVRAILAGRKTQTRRVVKWNHAIGGIHPAVASIANRGDGWFGFEADAEVRRIFAHSFPTATIRCPYGQPGDRLWVRETWRTHEQPDDGLDGIRYRADGGFQAIENTSEAADAWLTIRWSNGWRPSIFMPRWASRITLEITGVRVERLKDFSDRDAIQEGILGEVFQPRIDVSGIAAFRRLWESINGPGSWEQNPWVWVIEFRRVEK